MEEKTTLKIPCEVYSRVVGYYRPVSNWNNGKQQEFSERVAFCEETSMKNSKFTEEAVPILKTSEIAETKSVTA